MHISHELLMYVHTYIWDHMNIHASMHKHTPSTIDWHGKCLWHPCMQISNLNSEQRNDNIFLDFIWEQLRSTIFGWDRSSLLLALCASWIAAKCCSDPRVNPLQFEIDRSVGCYTSTLSGHSMLCTQGLSHWVQLTVLNSEPVWRCSAGVFEHDWTVQGGWRTPKWIWLSHLSSRLC